MPICHEPCGGRYVNSHGIARHRKAHLDRGEEVVVTLASGTWRYTPDPRFDGPDAGGATP